MARPHIEFIQAQALPWEPGLYAGDRPGVESKLLSRDDETDAASTLIRYPKGWTGLEADFVSADEEFLVLEGSLTIGKQTYGKYGFGLLPAGYPRGAMGSDSGAVVFTCFSAPPKTGKGSSDFDERKLVKHFDGLTKPYKNEWARMGSEDVNVNGIAMKLLREDPDTKDQTWLLGAVAGWPGGAIEIHPVVEEMYLVAGEIVGPLGNMRTGAYFWRPPHIEHGPFGTAKPSIHLFRTEGGPLSTEFLEPREEFKWRETYTPILPDSLAAYGREEWQGELTHG